MYEVCTTKSVLAKACIAVHYMADWKTRTLEEPLKAMEQCTGGQMGWTKIEKVGIKWEKETWSMREHTKYKTEEIEFGWKAMKTVNYENVASGHRQFTDHSDLKDPLKYIQMRNMEGFEAWGVNVTWIDFL